MIFSLLAYFSLAYTVQTQCPELTSDNIDTYCNELEEGTATNTLDDTNVLSSSHRYRCCRQGLAGKITISVPIPAEAFYQSTKINNVELKEGVTQIGDAAFFGCTNLVLTVSFNSDLNSIGDSAFEGCIQLDNDITFSGATIGEYAFKDCNKLTGTLTLSPRKDITSQSISTGAFENIPLTSLVLGSKVSNIGERAFMSTKITSKLDFTKTLTQIDTKAFKNSPISGLTFVKTDSSFSIGNHAFENTKIVQDNLIIPDSCSSLGEYAFARIPLGGTVQLGENIVEIEPYLFYNSTVQRVTIPNGPATINSFQPKLSSIGKHAFDYTKLSGTIDFGRYIRIIDDYAFKSTNIKKINDLPDSLQTIGKFAFYECTQLEGEITLRNTLNSIGEGAFEKTAVNGPLTIGKTLTIGKRTFAGTQLTELTIYNHIPESAFEGIKSLKILRVDFSSNTYNTIDKNAFKDCAISSIMEFYSVEIKTDAFFNAQFTNGTSGATLFFKDTTISSYAFRYFQISKCLINLTDASIKDNAFETMTGQPTVNFHHVVNTDEDSSPSPPTNVIGAYAFYNTEIQGNLDIPSFIKTIKQYAFAYCSGLTGYLNINATQIYNYAFYSSGFIGSLNLGSEVGLISAYENDEGNVVDAEESFTFRRCNFNALTLNNEGSITSRAFYKMTSIVSSLTIPETVTNIGKEAFAGCHINKLIFESNPNPDIVNGANSLTIDDAAFMGCTKIGNDLVINRALSKYEIKDYVFHGCDNIKSLTFDTKLTTIGSFAFYGCTKLSSISFPKEIDSIGYFAFAECTGLSCNLNIYQATMIGNSAFQNCAGLNGALDLSSVYYIGNNAFSGCTGFDQNLTVHNPTFYQTYPVISGIALPYIGDGAFSGCRNLKGSLPLSKFKTIGKRAFYECSGLNGQLSFPAIDVEDYTFYRCSGLNGPLVLQSDNIGKYAFYGCSGFSGEFKVPDEVQSIGQYAFAGCSGLRGPLEFPFTTTFIGKGAFSGCKGFSDHLDINVGVDTSHSPASSNVLRIEDRAFEDCSGFKKGTLNIYVENDEMVDHKTSNYFPHYRYPYFLRIQNKAFDGTKFKNIYYNGRFQPDCDHDIGISSIKGIHTSSNYVNKSFCGNPVHKSKLSGGAIAGIVIAVIIVVAAIVVLIVFLILRNKKNKDNSEGEVEMNNEP